ncbi:MAG TPA: hypothetical protein VFA59_04125 [Vicinamibacterales bacterium]|nr:hypothetical protein [Vicinamibacterales bacterium]
MAKHENVETRIQSIDERLARLRASKSRLLARANRTERKRDTRRKILIGGAVLAAVEHEGMPAISSTSELLHWLDEQLTREHDRAVFDLPPAATNGRLPIGPMSNSPRADPAVKDAAQTRHRDAARTRP